jgi:hypothetical protein
MTKTLSSTWMTSPACGTSDGPILIEATTQRLVGHYFGDAQLYRPAGEIEQARAACFDAQVQAERCRGFVMRRWRALAWHAR